MTLKDPYTNNLYCGLKTSQSLQWIVSALTRLGWDARMCSSVEHELACEHADLTLIPTDPPLLSGGIRPGDDSLHYVLDCLRAIDVVGDYELYNDKDELIAQGVIDRPC